MKALCLLEGSLASRGGTFRSSLFLLVLVLLVLVLILVLVLTLVLILSLILILILFNMDSLDSFSLILLVHLWAPLRIFSHRDWKMSKDSSG